MTDILPLADFKDALKDFLEIPGIKALKGNAAKDAFEKLLKGFDDPAVFNEQIKAVRANRDVFFKLDQAVPSNYPDPRILENLLQTVRYYEANPRTPEPVVYSHSEVAEQAVGKVAYPGQSAAKQELLDRKTGSETKALNSKNSEYETHILKDIQPSRSGKLPTSEGNTVDRYDSTRGADDAKFKLLLEERGRVYLPGVIAEVKSDGSLVRQGNQVLSAEQLQAQRLGKLSATIEAYVGRWESGNYDSQGKEWNELMKIANSTKNPQAFNAAITAFAANEEGIEALKTLAKKDLPSPINGVPMMGELLKDILGQVADFKKHPVQTQQSKAAGIH